MKTQATLAIALFLTATGLRAQGGSLTPPPGPPAPVMRTLDELYNKATAVETQNNNQTTQLTSIQTKVDTLETRTAVNTLAGDADSLHVISQPGSYYLNANITGAANKYGIEITASNVTLDLNGFALIGVANATNGIICYGEKVRIANGRLTDWSGGSAIMINAHDATVEDVSIETSAIGIFSGGSGTQVRRCTVSKLTGTAASGIRLEGGIVSDCTVRDINQSISTIAFGISADVVTRCIVSDVKNTLGGITCGISGVTISECVVTGVSAVNGPVFNITGMTADRCVVYQTVAPSSVASTHSGISVTTAKDCVVRSLKTKATGETRGIEASLCSNCVVADVENGSTGAVVGIKQRSLPTLSTVITGCVVSNIAGTGISAPSQAGAIENNHVKSCDGTAISASLAVMRNNVTSLSALGIALNGGYATGNVSYSDTTAFSFGMNCRYGPIVTGGGAGGFDATSNFDQ